jgi:uncharacterized protein (TIGR03437 family)
VNQPRVLVGSSEAKVFYSGLAPGFPGVYQVNAQVPDGVTAVNAMASLQIGGKQSNSALLR